MNDSGQVAPIVDSHLHLDEPAFDADRDQVLRLARRVGVRRFINIAHIPERWESSRALCARHPDLDIVLGVHPQRADEFDARVAEQLRDLVAVATPVAVGETGLDFFRSGPSRELQEGAFRTQLEIAVEARLPVVIHQRSASDALIAVLDDFPEVASIVLHSFDGTSRLADWARERGCYFGIGGLATKPGADSLRKTLRRVSVDRLLLETDAPYLAPPGTRERRNSPANLPYIAALLAPLWDLDRDELCRITTSTATAVFGEPRVAAHSSANARPIAGAGQSRP